MPCDDGSAHYDALEKEKRDIEFAHARKAMAILCDLCKRAEQTNKVLPEPMKLWWDEHKERDRKKAAANGDLKAIFAVPWTCPICAIQQPANKQSVLYGSGVRVCLSCNLRLQAAGN